MKAVEDTLSFDYPTAPCGIYCVYDINELNDDVEYEDKCLSVIGWGDFITFNLLPLMLISTNSSIAIKASIAFGCLVIVELGNLCNGFILHYSDFECVPTLPLPTIAVTAYAIAVDAITEYSNLDCEDPLK